MSENNILIIYYSRYGATAKMADFISRGIEAVPNMQAKIRTVPSVSPDTERSLKSVPDQGAPYATHADLIEAKGIIIGSPTRFGNMAAPLKYFLDSTSSLWVGGSLINKPAACFTSTASMHGGQESTLLSMMLPLIHHGCIIVGVPFNEMELHTTQTGGTPYGPSHLAGQDSNLGISESEKKICFTLGKRVAEIATRLLASLTD